MPLTYRDLGTSKTQLEVLSHQLVIAHIRKDFYSIMAGGGEVWFWHMISPKGPEGYHQHGTCNSLDEAKAGVNRMWDMWVKSAGLRGE